ncbi:hypothetical protein [Methylobacterium sp. JK268]
MRGVLCAVAAVGFGLIGSLGVASAQPWGGPDDDGGYRERVPGYGERYRDREYRERDDRDRGYRERRPDYGFRGRDRDDDDRPRRPPREEREFGFNEQEYLRCNPDVRRAVENGQMESGLTHFRVHGRREGRKLTC